MNFDQKSTTSSHGKISPGKLSVQVNYPGNFFLPGRVTWDNVAKYYLVDLPDKFKKLPGEKHQVTFSGKFLHSRSRQQTFFYLRMLPVHIYLNKTSFSTWDKSLDRLAWQRTNIYLVHLPGSHYLITQHYFTWRLVRKHLIR